MQIQGRQGAKAWAHDSPDSLCLDFFPMPQADPAVDGLDGAEAPKPISRASRSCQCDKQCHCKYRGV